MATTMTFTLRLAAAAAMIFGSLLGAALAAEEGETSHYPIKHPRYQNWTFAGPFGTYNPQQLQRGFQVYQEVCSSCHSLDLVAFRNLGSNEGPHFSAEEVTALAAEYTIEDGPDDVGDMYERPGIPADRFPSPFPNKQAAQASNNGAYPPDMSLMAKNRAVERGFPTFVFDIFTQYQESGPDYIYSLLTGYEDPPADMEIRDGLYYNPYFLAGTSLAMAPPLSDDLIEYAQNLDENSAHHVPQTTDQYAKDVSAFLMWAAEPHMVARKRMGLNVMIFLVVFAGLLYYTKKKVWASAPR